MKEIWTKCWDEFSAWFISQWKFAWELLSVSIIGLIQACFEWLKTIVGGAFAGLWKLVVKPVGKWCYDKLVEWVKKI
jgi:hypothetical protein